MWNMIGVVLTQHFSVLSSHISFLPPPCSLPPRPPASPPGSSHIPLLLLCPGFSKRSASPPWTRRSSSVPSTKARCTAAPLCAPWSPAPPLGARTITLAWRCPWTSTTCSTSETCPTFSRGSVRHRRSGNASCLATETVRSAQCCHLTFLLVMSDNIVRPILSARY